MVQMTLSEREWEVLLEIAEENLAELHSEIRDTDDHEYKRRLKAKEETLRAIIERLEVEHSSRV